MEKLYIIDLIGIHSGMHYYHEAFSSVLLAQASVPIRILSNYPISEKKAFYKNIYNKSTVKKIISLTLTVFKTIVFVITHHNQRFVYLTYGTNVDALFMAIFSFCKKNTVIDIHEVNNINKNNSDNKIFKFIYQHLVRNAISHSKKTNDILLNLGYKKKIYFVPHFPYTFSEEINWQNIHSDVENSIRQEKLMILFFGHIRPSKGIDLFFNMINLIQDLNILKKYHFIIAGNDTDNLIKKYGYSFTDGISHSIILRTINDDEQKFLFKNTHYVMLPYKTVSQSGVLEMAIKYKKPVLLSRIPQFESYIESYPSFGHAFTLANNKELEILLGQILSKSNSYYSKNDTDKYYSNDAFKIFAKEFLNTFME